ncbi:vitelline membrane outer layer protein 1 homolog [Pleurodeles waltl]|uniref:vitelline membrane outer layer protein 1 homolog n=1 Tax=Pleurodeles waltl TaxID=8319 RepID=UPI003709B14A
MVWLLGLLCSLAFCLQSAHGTEIRANGIFSGRQYNSIIGVTNGGPWGSWTWIDMCPEGSYAKGYSVKVEKHIGAGDDTSLNGIRLYCTSQKGVTYTIESSVGEFGDWSPVTWCPAGYLKSFQLKVEEDQGALDDTAANNIKFRCTAGAIIEGPGGDFGQYGGWSDDCAIGGICGMETKMEPYGGAFVDDTSINDVRFYCC